jgi:hypothetical protein
MNDIISQFNFQDLKANSPEMIGKMQQYLVDKGLLHKTGDYDPVDKKLGIETTKALQRLVGTKDDGI